MYLDSLRSYLQEIRSYPRLKQDQERSLAYRIREGDFQARQDFIQSNLRLVVSIAKSYLGRGLCLADLVEEGNVGLLKAVDGYDPDQNVRFSTYAVWEIKKEIRLALKDTHFIKLPQKASYIRKKVFEEQEHFISDGKCPPPWREIYDDLVKQKKLKALSEKCLIAAFSLQPLLFLDQHYDLQGSSSLYSLLYSYDDSSHNSSSSLKKIRTALTTLLSPREIQVLRLYYGVDDEEGKGISFEIIGKSLGVSRETVRKVEMKARSKLLAKRPLLEALLKEL